jgi:transcriptional regulator with XRE-family HTH domain
MVALGATCVQLLRETERKMPEAKEIPFETPLKKARKKAGMSIYELAEKAGCAPSTVSRVERDGQGISSELAEKLVKGLGEDLITEEQILYPARFMKAA